MNNEDTKKWGTENPFRIPDGYFENLNRQIHEKVNPQRNNMSPIPGRLSLIAPWLGLAAAFLIIALAYRQLPERVFPGRSVTKQIDAETILETSPWYLPGDYELMEFLSDENDLNLNIYPDSIIFEGINEEDLNRLTFIE